MQNLMLLELFALVEGIYCGLRTTAGLPLIDSRTQSTYCFTTLAVILLEEYTPPFFVVYLAFQDVMSNDSD